MAKCEFGSCRVEGLYNQKEELYLRRQEIFVEVCKGPDDRELVDAKMEDTENLQSQIDDLARQIGSIVVCGRCSWR